MPQRRNKIRTDNEQMNEFESALNGDILISIVPEAVTNPATAAAWTRDVVLKVVNQFGEIHTWLTQDFAATLSIADTSTAGTATIASTTLSIVQGEATVTVTGDAAAWDAAEDDTLTIDNITINGNTVVGGTSVETFE